MTTQFKILAVALVTTLALSACNKDTPTDTSSATTQATETATNEMTHSHDSEATHEEHNHEGHDHSHEGHDHNHNTNPYTCGDKTINIVVHDHEGEVEAHVIIDDIEYDLHPDTNTPNVYISQNEGINNQGMVLKMEADKATLSNLDQSVTHFECTKAS